MSPVHPRSGVCAQDQLCITFLVCRLSVSNSYISYRHVKLLQEQRSSRFREADSPSGVALCSWRPGFES
jgi:hypothetical protein